MSVTRRITAVAILAVITVALSLSTALAINHAEARDTVDQTQRETRKTDQTTENEHAQNNRDESPWVAAWNEPGSPRFNISGYGFEPGIVLVQYRYELVKLRVTSRGFETTVVYQRAPESRFETIVVIQGNTVLTEKIQVPGYDDLKVSQPNTEVANFLDFITFEGSGWRSNFHTSGIGKNRVAVVVSSATHVHTEMIPTNRWGGFQYLYRIPPTLAAPGTVTFTFTNGKKSFIRSVEVKPAELLNNESLPVSAYRGTAGETLTITATGLQPYAFPEILIDGMKQHQNPHRYNTDREGWAETEIVLPDDIGRHTIVIRTAEHGGYAEAQAELVIFPN